MAYLYNMTGYQWNRKVLWDDAAVILLQWVDQWANHDQAILSDMEHLAATINQSTA